MIGRYDVLTGMVLAGRALGVAHALARLGATSGEQLEALAPAMRIQRELAAVDPVAGRVVLEQINAFLHGDAPIEGTVVEAPVEIEA